MVPALVASKGHANSKKALNKNLKIFTPFSDFAQVAPPGSGTLLVLFVYNYTITLVIKSNAQRLYHNKGLGEQ